MRVKEHYMLRQVAESWVVLPLENALLDFNGMLTLNDSGAELWKLLEQGIEKENLINYLVSEYQLTYEQAKEDTEAFLERLCQIGCIDFD